MVEHFIFGHVTTCMYTWVYSCDWPDGQKQPSILCSSHSELVSVCVHVSRQGEPLSEYSMLKGQVTAKRVEKNTASDQNRLGSGLYLNKLSNDNWTQDCILSGQYVATNRVSYFRGFEGSNGSGIKVFTTKGSCSPVGWTSPCMGALARVLGQGAAESSVLSVPWATPALVRRASLDIRFWTQNIPTQGPGFIHQQLGTVFSLHIWQAQTSLSSSGLCKTADNPIKPVFCEQINVNDELFPKLSYRR